MPSRRSSRLVVGTTVARSAAGGKGRRTSSAPSAADTDGDGTSCRPDTCDSGVPVTFSPTPTATSSNTDSCCTTQGSRFPQDVDSTYTTSTATSRTTASRTSVSWRREIMVGTTRPNVPERTFVTERGVATATAGAAVTPVDRRGPTTGASAKQPGRRYNYVMLVSPDDPRHGTWNAYSNLGCRCDRCRQAASEYNRERRRRGLARDRCACGAPKDSRASSCRACWLGRPREIPHATETGYKSGCRCLPCRAAAASARTGRRHRLSPAALAELRIRDRDRKRAARAERMSA